MFDALILAYLMQQEQASRQAVVYPAAARRAQLDREVRALCAEGRTPRMPVRLTRWLGTTGVRVGTRRGGPALRTAAPGR